MAKTPCLTVMIDGERSACLVPAPKISDKTYAVFIKDTFLAGIEWAGDLDWKIVAAPTKEGVWKDTLLNKHLPRFELHDDAVAYLAEQYGYHVERCQMTFREAVEHDLTFTAEQRAYWLSVCDAGNV